MNMTKPIKVYSERERAQTAAGFVCSWRRSSVRASVSGSWIIRPIPVKQWSAGWEAEVGPSATGSTMGPFTWIQCLGRLDNQRRQSRVQVISKMSPWAQWRVSTTKNKRHFGCNNRSLRGTGYF